MTEAAAIDSDIHKQLSEDMFAPIDRSSFRESLVAYARADSQVVGAALVGSAARGAEDAWSDIDLVLQLAPDADEPAVVNRWTRWIDAEQGTADTFDVMAQGVRYRVFLLRSSLQVDVSFWPHDEFRATEDGFRLLFGTASPPTAPAPPDVDQMIGMGWLYALHARSALARGKLWQSILMLDDLRNQIVGLACVRQRLNPWHGRDVDRLPSDELEALADARAAHVTADAISLSKRKLCELFLAEIERHDPARASRLREPSRWQSSPNGRQVLRQDAQEAPRYAPFSARSSLGSCLRSVRVNWVAPGSPFGGRPEYQSPVASCHSILRWWSSSAARTAPRMVEYSTHTTTKNTRK